MVTRLEIPLVPVPSQQLAVRLGDQSCTIKAYQKAYGFFLDLYVGDALIIGGVQCHNNALIVITGYLGFVGDLFFTDTAGTDDPSYEGLGSRWLLIWETA